MKLKILILIFGFILLTTLVNADRIEDAKTLKNKACQDVKESSKEAKDKDRETIRSSAGDTTQIELFFKGYNVDATAFIQRYAVVPVIFIAFGALSFLGWYFCTLTCLCQNKLCPPCRSCCNCCKNEQPYSNLGIKFPAIGGIVFMIWVIVVACIGVTQAPEIQNANQSVLCTSMSLMDSLVYGDLQFGWKGMYNLSLQIDQISSQMQQIEVKIDETFDGTNNLVIDDQKIQTELNTLNQTFQYQTNPLGGSGPVESVFLSSSVYKDFITQLKTNLDNSAEIEKAVKELDDIGNDLKSNNIENDINEASDHLYDTNDGIAQIMFEMYDGYDVFTTQFKLGTLALTIILGVFIGISLVTAIILGYSMIKKNYKFRIGLHFSWFFFSLVMTITFILGGAFKMIALVGIDSCSIIDQSLSDQASAQKYFPSEFYDQMVTCSARLNGTGDLLSQGDFDILAEIKDFQAQIDTYQQNSGDDSQNFKELNNFISVLDNVLISNLTSIQLNSYSTSENGTEIYDVMGLENLINDVNSACVANQLRFKHDGACPSASGMNCFWVGKADADNDNNLKNILKTGNLACTSKESSIIGWREEKQPEFSKRVNSSKIISQEFSDFKSDLNTFQVKMNNMLTEVENTLESITNNKTGIVSGLNCTFLGNSLDLFYDSICINFVLSLSRLSDRVIILSFGMFFGAFFIYCTAWRYSNQDALESNSKKHGSNDNHQNVNTTQMTDRSTNLELALRGQVQNSSMSQLNTGLPQTRNVNINLNFQPNMRPY